MADPIGAPIFYPLGDSAAPGAQAVDVPADATHVAIFVWQSDDTVPSSDLTAMAADFVSGAWDIAHTMPSAVAMGGAIALAQVTSTGTGKTWTPTFTTVNTLAGAGAYVWFFKNVGATWPNATSIALATGTGYTAATASATGVAGGIAIAVDVRISTTAGGYPANEVGWTSQGINETGPGSVYGYYTGARIRTKAITADGTETATTQTVQGNVVMLLTIGVPAASAPTIDTNPTKQIVAVGSDATFSGTAHSNGGTGLTLLWQIDTGGGWTDLPGATFPVTIGMDGAAVSFLAADSVGSTRSASAVLDVYQHVFDPAYFDPAYFDTQQIGGGTVNASASAGDVTSGIATASVQVFLAASGGDVSIGSGNRSATVAAGAVGLDVSTGAAGATANVSISAAGLAEAAASVGVSTQVMAAAAGAAQAAGNGQLAALIAALAGGADEASGVATGTLAGGGNLPASATGGDVTTGQATIAVTVQLQGAGANAAIGAATAGAGQQTGAQGANVTDGAAALTVTVQVTAAGFIQAAGAGVLQVSVPLSAFGAVRTGGQATASIADAAILGPIRMRTRALLAAPMTIGVRPAINFVAGPTAAVTYRAEVISVQ